MKRSMTLLLPLLAVLASCGTTAQYSQQRYQDGIYFQTAEEPEEVVVLSKEDFERLAAQNIRQQSLEEVVDSSKITYTQVYPGDYYYDMYFSPFPAIALWAGTDLAFTSWYWDRWRLWWGPYGPMGPYDTFWFDFNRPYFGWGSWGWYDPWYYGGYGWGWGWRDPWAPYWDPWYYRSGWYRYDPWYGNGYYGGGGFIRNVSYGPRYQTQPVGSRTIHAGSGASVTRGTTPVYGTRTTPATRTTNGTVTRISPSGTGTDRSLSEGYNRRAVTPSTGRSGSGSSGSYNRSTSSPSSRTYSRPSTSSSSSRTYSRPSTSSSSTRSYSSGSSSRSYSSGSTSSSSSRSYSSGGGGGFSSGGGHSSSGSASHSGGGGGSHGGRR